MLDCRGKAVFVVKIEWILKCNLPNNRQEIIHVYVEALGLFKITIFYGNLKSWPMSFMVNLSSKLRKPGVILRILGSIDVHTRF